MLVSNKKNNFTLKNKNKVVLTLTCTLQFAQFRRKPAPKATQGKENRPNNRLVVKTKTTRVQW